MDINNNKLCFIVFLPPFTIVARSSSYTFAVQSGLCLFCSTMAIGINMYLFVPMVRMQMSHGITWGTSVVGYRNKQPTEGSTLFYVDEFG